MRKDPLLADIPVRVQKEGHTARIGDADMDYKLCSVTTQLPSRIGEGLSVAEFYDAAEEIGNKMAEQQAKILFAKMSEPSAISQPISFGPNMSFDDMLSIWEKMEVRFDRAGTPIWPTIFSNEEGNAAVKQILLEAAEDPESRRKWSALIKKKRREFDEREARRRLVE